MVRKRGPRSHQGQRGNGFHNNISLAQVNVLRNHNGSAQGGRGRGGGHEAFQLGAVFQGHGNLVEGTKVTVILSEALASGKKVELIVGALVDAEYAANATTAAATYTAP